MTHICVGKLTNIDSDNGLSPGWRQAIIWTNAGISLIGPLETNFSEILIGVQTFSFKKMHLKVLSAKWRPFCLGFNKLMMSYGDIDLGQHWLNNGLVKYQVIVWIKVDLSSMWHKRKTNSTGSHSLKWEIYIFEITAMSFWNQWVNEKQGSSWISVTQACGFLEKKIGHLVVITHELDDTSDILVEVFNTNDSHDIRSVLCIRVSASGVGHDQHRVRLR